MQKCRLVQQGYERGSCTTYLHTLDTGEVKTACEATLKKKDKLWYRVVRSAHLSRPEHYFSIYMSGCNQTCLKCHSADFTKKVSGDWLSTEEIAELCASYEQTITYEVKREKALMWYASDICKCCGSCILKGERSVVCPKVLTKEKVVLSPQGFGPATNIIAYTGGDLACCPDFYVQLTEKIKEKCKKCFVLFETNGYGLTPENLELLRGGGIDSFWLDIKAYDEKTYRKLCGVSNKHILSLPERILDLGFELEILALYIPNWVEKDELVKIAKLITTVDPYTPFTLLAFFPSYRLIENRAPNIFEILNTYTAMKEEGLKRIKIGNCHVFARSREEWSLLEAVVGKEGIG
ncbi:MAG: radical SAM protein [Candidatus Thermoplasmatota archaeon]